MNNRADDQARRYRAAGCDRYILVKEQELCVFHSIDQPEANPRPVAEGCHAGKDGDCDWSECPQLQNYQTGCPLANWDLEEEGEPVPTDALSPRLSDVQIPDGQYSYVTYGFGFSGGHSTLEEAQRAINSSYDFTKTGGIYINVLLSGAEDNLWETVVKPLQAQVEFMANQLQGSAYDAKDNASLQAELAKLRQERDLDHGAAEGWVRSLAQAGRERDAALENVGVLVEALKLDSDGNQSEPCWCVNYLLHQEHTPWCQSKRAAIAAVRTTDEK